MHAGAHARGRARPGKRARAVGEGARPPTSLFLGWLQLRRRLMNEEPDIREAARTIRSYLPSLRDTDAAEKMDAALARLRAEDASDERIIAEFERYEASADWAAAFVEYGVPPELASVAERNYSEVPGYGERVRLPKFACPHGD